MRRQSDQVGGQEEVDNLKGNEREIALIDLYLREVLAEMENIGESHAEQEPAETVSR
jgi:hypothetical protein